MSSRAAPNGRRHITLIRVAGIAAGLLLLALATWYLDVLLDPVLDLLEAMEDRIREQPLLVYGVFIGLFAVLVASAIPVATPLTIAAGLLFGLPAGAAASLAGSVIGSFGTYLMARAASESRLRNLRRRVVFQRVLREIESDEALYLILLRIMPVMPFVLVNLALAMLPVPPARFLLTTTVGLIPSMLVYAAVGTGLDSVVEAGDVPASELITDPAIWVPLGGLTGLIIVSLVVRGLTRRRRR